MSKLIALVGVVALFGVSLASRPNQHAGKGQEIIGPIEWNCTRNGAVPYLECDKYVDCWEGQAMLGQCTDLMLFDLNYDGCNFAQNVDCGDRLRPTNVPSTITPPMSTTTSNVSTTTTERPSEEFTCPDDGVFAHEERCEYYWSCYMGVSELIHCRDDYLFDLVYMGCNFPEYTHCQDRARPPGSSSTAYPPISTTSTAGPTTAPTGPTTTRNPSLPTTTTTAAPGPFECPEWNGNYPDPLDCTAFYQCSLNIPYHQFCPDGLYYNPLIETCDFPQNVDCKV